MIDWTFNVPSIIGGIGALVTMVVFLARLGARIDTAERDISAVSGRVSAVEATVVLVREQFHDYQLQVAKEYVTHSALLEIKRDLITEISRMEGRVETQINRLAHALKGD